MSVLTKGAGGSAPKADLLWTNPSPTASFAAQTVSLNLSSYRYVVVTTNLSTSNSQANGYGIGKVGASYDTCMGTKSWDSANSRMNANIRRFRASATGVQFYGGGYSTAESSNGKVIPYRIYGIKEDLGIL